MVAVPLKVRQRSGWRGFIYSWSLNDIHFDSKAWKNCIRRRCIWSKALIKLGSWGNYIYL